jgi:hypothetical protein
MQDDLKDLGELLRLEMDDIEFDFSTTKSFADAVTKAKEEIVRTFEESLTEAKNPRAAVKVKEVEPA